MRRPKGGLYQQVVIFMTRIVAPEIAWTYGQGPVRRSGHPVRPVKHTDKTVNPNRCPSIAFPLVPDNPAMPDDTGEAPPNESHPRR